MQKGYYRATSCGATPKQFDLVRQRIGEEMSPTENELRLAPLKIGISTRALFNLEEEHTIFEREGVAAYAALQLKRENDVIAKGTGFEVVRRLLDLNVSGQKPYVEVFLISRNSPDLSLRAFKSIEEYGLSILKGSFTSGRSVGPLIPAWNIDLFLSNEQQDVQAAVNHGAAGARLFNSPESESDNTDDEVRIAFDGDAVVLVLNPI